MQYSTTFPLTENPISQGGNWINGGTTGLDWANVAVVNGLAHGTETGMSQNEYDDSTALLKGVWGPNQMASATVFATNQTTDVYEEIEIRLRSTITPHSCTGYEILFRACLGGYCTIARWNGALGDFTYVNQNPNSNYHGISNGDVVSASISNNVIIGYVNGVEVIRGTDSTWTSGNPGIGFWLEGGPPSRVLDYGFTSFTASDGITNATPGFTLTVVNGIGSGTYNSNTVVNISASIPSGEPFKYWSGSYIANTNSANTTVTMPAGNLTVTANYVPFPPTALKIVPDP